MKSVYESRPWTHLYPSRASAPHTSGTGLGLWRRTVEEDPDGICLHLRSASYTWRDIDRESDSFASGLERRGLRLGDRVGILLQNDREWLVSLLGTWKAGGTAVALNPMFKARELSFHLEDSGSTFLVALGELLNVVHEVVEASSLSHVFVVGGSGSVDGELFEDFGELLGSDAEPRHEAHPEPSDVAVLTYTSGTTGIPKGAMNTHGNIAYNAELAASWFDLGPHDAILGVAPLFHITGLVLHMALSWSARAPLILLHRFDPTEAVEAAERSSATFTVGSITVFKALVGSGGLDSRAAPTLTKMASGGAPIAQATLQHFEQETGRYIHNVYGLTETTSPSHAVPLGSRAPTDPSGAVSVGVPLPGVSAKVVDVATWEEVPVGEVGEVIIEGPMVVPGYWQRPDETEHAIPGGSLHTGDVGYMDEDGWFYIVDRAKDLINAAGYKVWPREVEDVLYQHPLVREAAVVGVPDEYRGETIKAYVALADAGSVSHDELIEFCRERMAAFKYPRMVEIVDEIPKTPTGKYLRRALRDREGA